MQTPSVVLNIGADVAKVEIVVACSEGSFPVRKIANQRIALLAFLKGVPAGSRIGAESTGSYHELFADAAHLTCPKTRRDDSVIFCSGGHQRFMDLNAQAPLDGATREPRRSAAPLDAMSKAFFSSIHALWTSHEIASIANCGA